MAKDGSKQIMHVAAADAGHADALVAALNAKNPFNGFFKFTHVPADGGVMVVATGQWSLPGSQRPAHGTMQTWADGYLTCLRDAAAKAKAAGAAS